VHLKVADLDRAIAFYRDALGLNVTADGREFDAAGSSSTTTARARTGSTTTGGRF
jgi:catechol-2,3-dioxygenase